MEFCCLEQFVIEVELSVKGRPERLRRGGQDEKQQARFFPEFGETRFGKRHTKRPLVL